MTKEEAKKILSAYREIDDDTNEEYGYIIQDYVGEDDEAYIFRCKIEGVDYDSLTGIFANFPLMAVYSDGTVLTVPE